ncbi:TerC family protein [Bacillaceae bacterium S4-13-58]
MDLEIIKSILVIVGIDIILGGDNAIVIAMASRNLPSHQRNKAIFLGTGLAIVVRVMLTAVAVYLLAIPYLSLVGGLLLIFIAINLLTEQDEEIDIKGSTSLIKAVQTIVFADFVMGFDNVLAIAGASKGNILLVATGLLISVPIIIWGSKLILALMERFSILIYIGAGILAYTASEMIVGEDYMADIFERIPKINVFLTILIISFVIVAGYLINQKKK